VPSRHEIDRRTALIGALMLIPGAATMRVHAAARRPSDLVKSVRSKLAGIERQSGGRLGVAIVDTASGERAVHRGDERFPMCSTFKFLVCGAVLARVDKGEERLDRRIPFGEKDLLEYAPVTRARVKEGGMSVGELCDAAMTVSDNTAANLLLSTMDGPAGLTAYLRTLGDTVTRLDRTEPTLNEATLDDPRDTTTPIAMLGDLNTLLIGEVLSAKSRERLMQWLVANTTGDKLLRAGLPEGWQIGDKTGRGAHGTTNDIAILWPPGYSPMLITVYLTNTRAASDQCEAVIATVARTLTS
jgi:beta-lactamase class A